MDKRTTASCPKCGGTWPVFETVVSPDTRPSVVATMRVTETSLVEEAIGQEVRRIGNSGPASAVRRFKATRRWTRHIEFDNDHTTTSSHGVKFTALVELKSSAEATLRRHFGGSEEIEEKFEEEVELSIPPYTTLEFVMDWKCIWQQGLVTGVDTTGVMIQFPFRAAVGLTFDQSTR
ncbi:hypothetical protein BC739_001701 [Kutzneria viridogrisea]|uniref:Uncharacterized protein n=1 Tax=Kutzneria viridogrisea TaxID=47990 RepID=A0ABR6BD48_9PSEU|nr:hypothetical protein [Kutzneria viridogrisea]